ncbi:MAG: hypothetical protein M3R13_09390 [Armatimonadota bacterium]|nr:hypothetical protein [Armatimonadota bacterium]
MTPIALACAFISLFFSSVSIVGCDSAPDPSGRYFYFDGDRPTSDTFDVMETPIAKLTFTETNLWYLLVVVWDRSIMVEAMPLSGTWTREGDVLTLVDKDKRAVARFRMEGDALDYLDGIFPMKGKRFWKMSKKWEASAQEVGQRDATMGIARDIANATIIYAGDNDETLPAIQAEFEKGLAPYVANKAMFIGFTYTFKGGKLPPESKRGSVELGVLQGPTGKAIMFLNGERKWVPAK